MNDAENVNAPSPSAPAAPGNPQDLQSQIDGLRKILVLLLIILLMITGSVVFALRKQATVARDDLVTIRSAVLQGLEQFERNEKPVAKKFVAELQAYAKTHPDYAPIFSKYVPTLTQLGLISQEAAPANPQAPTLK